MINEVYCKEITKEKMNCKEHNKMTNILKSVENEGKEEDNGLLDSGRDSGISSDSPRYQETNAKLNHLEIQLERIALSSRQELQEAKKKLENLRFTRLEENVLPKDEISNLKKTTGKEENKLNFIEKPLNNFADQKALCLRKLSDLEKGQVIGSEITMLQEQEIAQLEVKLKEHELERFTMSQQLDHQRKLIIEKDKQRLKQQGEVYILKERMSQLEETNMFLKTESGDTLERFRNSEREVNTLKKDVEVLNKELEKFKHESSSSRLEMQQLKSSNTRLEDLVVSERTQVQDLQEQLRSQIKRYQNQEEDFHKRELLLQQDLDHASFNESKLSEKCEELEQLYHTTRRKKDEQHFELKQCQERVKVLEEELNEIEEQKARLEDSMNEMQHVLKKYVYEEENMASSPRYSPKLDLNLTRTISPEAMNDYFQRNASRTSHLQLEVTDLTTQIRMEQQIMAELNSTVADVKSQLEKTRANLKMTSKLKDTLELECDRANETIRMQERELQRKSEEISHLQERLKEFEDRVMHLESELTKSTNDNTKSAMLYKEERKTLKIKLQEIENEYHLLDSTKKRQEAKLQDEKSSLNEERRNKELQCEELKKENKDIKKEMENLIEDNKTLAQRLIHLETYSEKLGSVVEKHQADKDKLKDKIQKEMRSHKTVYEEKNMEISSLTQKLHDMNRSMHEKSTQNEMLGGKIKNAKIDRKNLENHIKSLTNTNEELQNKNKIINDAHTAAERKAISLQSELKEMARRFDGQNENIDELFAKMTLIENENKTLRDNFTNAEKRLELKESLIVELTKKTNEAAENYNALKSSIRQAELEGRDHEQRMYTLRNENMSLEKSMREISDENAHWREQVSNMCRLLSKTEDEKEKSFNEATYLQHELDSERLKMKQKNEQTNKEQKVAISELQSKISSLKDELTQERRLRQRLEVLYNQRDGQVSKLRNTFDESLNTITNDTKNIKHILGKSLKKLDRQILHNDGLVTDSDFTETDDQFLSPENKQRSRYQHYNSASRRSKSLEPSVDTLGERNKVRTPSPSSESHEYGKDKLHSSVLLPSSKPQLLMREYSSGKSPRDSTPKNRRSNKRVSR